MVLVGVVWGKSPPDMWDRLREREAVGWGHMPMWLPMSGREDRV
jgi:hypothetical protein